MMLSFQCKPQQHSVNIFRFAWRLSGSDWVHEHVSRLAIDTVDFQTRQLLIIKRSLCHITFCNYKCLNISLFHNSAVFYTSICYQSEWITAWWRWSIPPPCNINLFLTTAWDLHRQFPVGVVTRDKVKWLLGNLTAFSVSQPISLYQLR